MLVPPDTMGFFRPEPIIRICPECYEEKERHVISATSEQAARGLCQCPVHGVMPVSNLKQVNRSV